MPLIVAGVVLLVLMAEKVHQNGMNNNYMFYTICGALFITVGVIKTLKKPTE